MAHPQASLLDLASGRLEPLDASLPFVVGRSPDASLTLDDLTCSRRHFQVDRTGDDFWISPLSETSPTFLDGLVLKGAMPLHHGNVVRAGESEFRFLLRPGEPTSRDADGPSEIPPGPLLHVPDLLAPIALGGIMRIGRDPDRAAIVLPHVQVSRVHASIDSRGGRARVEDLDSANGTFVNGERLASPRDLEPGDIVGIGPYSMKFAGHCLIADSRANSLQLTADRLSVTVRGREGARITILDDVSLVARPHEFVAIIGPSGSGKSTLLETLSASRVADGGTVLLNHLPLRSHFDALRRDFVLVPQQDTFHEHLTVEQTLAFSARLRLPRDTGPAEIAGRVDQVLNMVGLAHRRAVPIHKLSGGQRKRASLANELISDPSLLFLDEVTSGLDEMADEELMQLFRSVADMGKTVVCVTHNLASVEGNCHLVAVLTVGGKLAFVGTPADALAYFQVDHLGDIYARLASHDPSYWQTEYRRSSHHAGYVAGRMIAASPPESARPPAGDSSPAAMVFLHQFPILARRYACVMRNDPKALLAMLSQGVIIGLLLILVFGNVDEPGAADPVVNAQRRAAYSGQLIFLVAVSCFWFGCNNAAKEIVKDRAICRKERRIGLQIQSYYASKFAPLCLLSLVQSSILFAMVSAACHLPGESIQQWGVLGLLALSGVVVGLFISAVAPTEEFAMSVIPLALIPQIILTNAFRPLDGLARTIGRACIALYWGYEALRSLLPDDISGRLDPAPLALSTSLTVLVAQVVAITTASVLLLRRLTRP